MAKPRTGVKVVAVDDGAVGQPRCVTPARTSGEPGAGPSGERKTRGLHGQKAIPTESAAR